MGGLGVARSVKLDGEPTLGVREGEADSGNVGILGRSTALLRGCRRGKHTRGGVQAAWPTSTARLRPLPSGTLSCTASARTSRALSCGEVLSLAGPAPLRESRTRVGVGG